MVVTKSHRAGRAPRRKVREAVARARDACRSTSCSNPEFLKEGAAVDDFMKPDRVVLGVETRPRAQRDGGALRAVRAHRASRSSSWTSPSAEMTKYAANAMLATRISFMNEIANLCERVGADVDLVRQGHRLATRASARRSSSRGRATAARASRRTCRRCCSTARRSAACRCSVLEAVEAVNERQKQRLFEKLRAALGGDLQGRAHRGLGAGLQAEHRRHARGAGARR